MPRILAPVHPGEVLREEFMTPQALSSNVLARAMRVPPNRVTAIVNGSRSISPDTALRLGKVFRTSPEFWLNLQQRHDLDVAHDVAHDL